MSKIIKSALATITGEVKKVHAERKQAAERIEALQKEAQSLKDMPVSRADFSLLLKENIAAHAAIANEDISRNLSASREDLNGNATYSSMNKTSMNALTTHHYRRLGSNRLFPNWILDNRTGGALSSRFPSNEELFPLLCWLIPDVIHEKIMAAADSGIGKDWGNDDLPSVADRRARLTAIEAETIEQQERLSELDEAIKGFGGLVEQEPPLSELQRLMLINNQ